MSDWKITDKSTTMVDYTAEVFTLGLAKAPTIYEITNKDTGEVKHVQAYSEKQVGEKIARGKMFD